MTGLFLGALLLRLVSDGLSHGALLVGDHVNRSSLFRALDSKGRNGGL